VTIEFEREGETTGGRDLEKKPNPGYKKSRTGGADLSLTVAVAALADCEELVVNGCEWGGWCKEGEEEEEAD